MYQSQMECLKIIFRSNGPLYPCFPRKFYALKLFPRQTAYFINVSLAYGTPENHFPVKWPTLSMFPS